MGFGERENANGFTVGAPSGDPPTKVWQHDLYKGNHQPYDEKELQILKEHINQSKKKEYEQRHAH